MLKVNILRGSGLAVRYWDRNDLYNFAEAGCRPADSKASPVEDMMGLCEREEERQEDMRGRRCFPSGSRH